MNREEREQWAKEFSNMKGKSPQKQLEKIREFIEKEYNLDINI